MQNTCLLIAVALLYAEAGIATTVLSPAGTPNSASAIPFLAPSWGVPSVRHQQVYRGSDFEGSGGLQPLWITEIGFKANYSVDLANIEIWFSTTTKGETDLSSVFAENLGTDRALAYGGPLHVVDNDFIPYGFRIQLQTPFLYDPQMGNLLMDVKNYVTATFPQGPGVPLPMMESRDATGDGSASAFSWDVDSPTALVVYNQGLSTLFVVEAVPEPSAFVLLIGGLTVAVALRRWRNRENDPSTKKDQ